MSLPRLHGLAMPTGPGAAPVRRARLRIAGDVPPEAQGPAWRCRCRRVQIRGTPGGHFYLRCGKCGETLVLEELP
jgi:hypothetical protein